MCDYGADDGDDDEPLARTRIKVSNLHNDVDGPAATAPAGADLLGAASTTAEAPASDSASDQAQTAIPPATLDSSTL